MRLGGSSGPVVRREGACWGLPECRGGYPGGGINPARVSRCGGGVSGLLRAGSRPSPRSSLSRGSSRSSTSPPPSFHLSRNGAARVHGGFVLRLRFSPGAGRCPVSPARPPLAWSSLAGFADSWLRPEGQGASRFPDVAPRCCVLGGGPLRPPPAREPLPHPPVCGFAPRSVGPWRCVASGACPPRGG